MSYFTTADLIQVSNDINGDRGLTYNNTQAGSLGVVCDCSGAMDQLATRLAGTAGPQWDFGLFFRQLYAPDQSWTLADWLHQPGQ